MKLSLCILSWRSHQTIAHTLESYERNGLLRLADEKLIFFQEMSRWDVRLAQRYRLDYFGSKRNIGIGGAYRSLAERASGEAVLFLQNDFVLREDLTVNSRELTSALALLESGEVEVVLLRHRRHPGVPHWAEDHVKGHEERWPSHLFNSIYWLESPDLAYPGKIWRAKHDPRYFVTTSQYANYTDNPSLYRREWLLRTLGDRFVARGPDEITWPEEEIQPWWQTQAFPIAQAEGLFTHIRLDRFSILRRILRCLLAAWRRIWRPAPRPQGP